MPSLVEVVLHCENAVIVGIVAKIRDCFVVEEIFEVFFNLSGCHEFYPCDDIFVVGPVFYVVEDIVWVDD